MGWGFCGNFRSVSDGNEVMEDGNFTEIPSSVSAEFRLPFPRNSDFHGNGIPYSTETEFRIPRKSEFRIPRKSEFRLPFPRNSDFHRNGIPYSTETEFRLPFPFPFPWKSEMNIDGKIMKI